MYQINSGKIIHHDGKHWKITKIAILAKIVKNSIFHKMGIVGLYDHIWSEMASWSVLDDFCTRNRYLNPFRSYFEQFRKNRFFRIFHLWDTQNRPRRNFYWCRNFCGVTKIGSKQSYVLPIIKAFIRTGSFWIFFDFRENWPILAILPKTTFLHIFCKIPF